MFRWNHVTYKYSMNADEQSYILLLLSDSNLPTGSFVASSGLESYLKHGFGAGERTITFVRHSLASYARSALPFVSDAHRIVNRDYACGVAEQLSALAFRDSLYDSMTLNHVTRRASKLQGVALLTLYAKGFAKPEQEDKMACLISQFKLMVRKEETAGHLPICWGILTAPLGLSLGTVIQIL